MIPASTYRLQVRASFDLYAVADVCDYLATLGVDALYLSPLLPSSRGSDHGYDVVAHDRVDAARGGLDGWTRAVAAARARGLRQVVDIVPNHAGVMHAEECAAWWAMLRDGPSSPYASWFDVDWVAGNGRVLLPVLGDGFDDNQLAIEGDELRYFEHRFPIAGGTGAGSPAEVHARQHYELVNYRRADAEQNYRRFFAVTTLAGLRVEDRAVFDATHVQIARWLRDDGIDGLRVDHPDGLADPGGYLAWLRELAGPDAWLLVEKILEPGEPMPDWPVDGDTGYAALTEVGEVLIDPAGERAFDALYRELTGDEGSMAEHIAAGKRQVATTILQAEIARMARLVPTVADAAEAFVELVVAFPVYRSYLPAGAAQLAAAVDTVRAARPDLHATLMTLLPRLSDPADELCMRFQQTTGAVMAKGVEDTAYYRYARFIAANEVGGDPGRFGRSVADFHAAQLRRIADVPRAMTALSTHDTKRGEDVRARLAVLAEVPDKWSACVRALMEAAPIPDLGFGYLLWQTFAGVGFIDRERMHAYAEKAMREASMSTTWTAPDETFESTVHAAVDAGYDDPAVHGPLAELDERIRLAGWHNALAQKLIQLTMPGVPDVYQGTELWDDSLVDPDNRRPVEYDVRRALLAALDEADAAPPIDFSGAAKLWVVSRALRARRDRAEAFTSYTPVVASGAAAEHVVAFDRGGALTVAARLPIALARRGGWRDTTVDVGSAAVNVLTGAEHSGRVTLSGALGGYPVGLFLRG